MTDLPPLPYSEPRRFPAAMGRPKGVPNKVTQTLKRAILIAGEVVGNRIRDDLKLKGEEVPGGLEGYLTMVAQTDVKAFCALLGRVLPMEVTGADGGAIEVVFKTVYEDAGDSAKVIDGTASHG